ncbi:MAG: SprT family zinc-dependent metalloprotease [Candidatus Nitrosotenuis sp.]
MKTSQITVDRDNVIVRTPNSKTASEIQNLVLQKAKWIYQKQLEFKRNKSSLVAPTFSDGSTIPLFGKNCLLRIRTGQKRTSVQFRRSQITINLKSKKSMKKTVKQTYENWLFLKATRYLQDRTWELAEKTRQNPSKIIIKRLKGRWGSATKDGVINLNFNLLKAHKDVIDYVIIHELCHLAIRKHSFQYWNLVKRHMPDYKDKIKWLETNHLIRSM